MMLDIRTVMLLYLITNVINAGAIAFIWSQNRRRYAGISFWLAAMTLQAFGPILHVLRGIIPDLISMTLSNTIMLAGVLIILIGLERFTDKKGRQIHNYVLLAVFIAVSAYFVVIQPNLTARDIAVSAMVMIYTFQCCWLLLRRADPGLRIITRLTGIVFAVYAAFNFARIILLVIFPDQTNDFYKSGAVNALAITGYILLNLGVTISLVLMVNRRLLADVRAQEEKFTTAFHSSPYAIILTRVSDGTILEVNDGFVNITGHQYAEVTGKTPLDLRLWVREEDRRAFVNKLTQGREVHAVEYQFRKKTGEVLTGLLSASHVTINNEKCILASIGDITERKRAEEALRESEERFRRLSEAALEGIIFHEEGKIIEANKVFVTMFGYSLSEVIGKNALDFATPELRETASRHISIGSEEPYDGVAIRKDGSTFPVEVHGKNAPYKGRTVRLTAVQDITDRKRAEEEKRRLEERSRKVVEDIFRFIPEGVLVFSRKMELLRQNQAFRELVSGYAKRLGFAEDELENLIIDKIKAGMGDNNIKEIRISRKHETGK
jgi:PAS domain S-box-containing protein